MPADVAGSSERRLRAPAVRAWLRLLRVSHKIERVLSEGLQAHGLSLAQFDVLAHVGAAEGTMQQELADSLFVTKGNVCQLLDRLEQRGLLERRKEGRANRLYLTPAGRQLFNAVVPTHEALVAEQFGILSPAEQSQLLGLLRAIDRALPT
jgi:DNA-binding MarR family transcriptional regulator